MPAGSAREDALLPLARAAQAELEHRFGPGGPIGVYFAPGRVNLMGAHLDYSGGPVMPLAVDRGTFVAVRSRPDRVLRLASSLEPGEVELDLRQTELARTGTWCDYPLGVVLALRRRTPDLAGLDLCFGGNLPIGGGLSSSASICVATAFAVGRALGLGLSAEDQVDAALRAEREFVGVQCGIMDPCAVGLAREGHLLWLDCKDRSSEHVPLDADRLGVAVADSGVRRDLARGDFNRRVAECAEAFRLLAPHVRGATCLRDVPADVLDAHASELPPVLARRARHVVDEVARTFRAKTALLAGDLAELGRLMVETHRSLRELYEVSIPELDCLVEAALEVPGVYGARLTGAGFGGCAVIVLRPDAAPKLAEHVPARFVERFGRRPRVDLFRSGGGPRQLLG